MYDDYKIIEEDKFNKLLNEYNLNIKVNATNLDEEFLTKFNGLLNFLYKSGHSIENLIKLSSNNLNLEILKDIKDKLNVINDKLKVLYNITETENNTDNNTDNINKNYEENYKQIVNNLLEFLKLLFNFISFENNIKIKNSLEIIFYDAIEILEELNKIETRRQHIFSLFKRY